MPAQGRPVLGVDINPTEIAVVEISGIWPNAQVLHADTIPTPPRALDGARILDADAVADALRELLNRMHVGTRDAVIGIGSRGVITRTLDIPRVPESEMRVVIEGELAHYQILRDYTGAFDYMLMDEPEVKPEGEAQVLLMAAEDATLSGYNEVADRAGLRVVGLEPIQLAMFRAAYPQIEALTAVACLSISYGEVELAIVERGQIRLYRRMDIGNDDLLSKPQAPQPGTARSQPSLAGRLMLGEEEEAEAEADSPQSQINSQVNMAAANNLAIELQRSLHFYRREYPEAEAITHAIVATTHPELAGFADWLSQALGIEAVAAALPASGAAHPSVLAHLESPTRLRFLGAAGLGMHELANPPLSLPCFDLSTRRRDDADFRSARRKLGLSLAFSAATVVLGLAIAYGLGSSAGRLEHEVEQKKADLNGLTQLRQVRTAEIETQKNVLQALKPQGFPFPRIMDIIAQSVSPRAGFTDVSLDSGAHLRLVGDAPDEKTVIETVEGMKYNSYFENTSLDSFDSTANAGTNKSVHFQISSQLAGVGAPKTP